MKKSFPPVFIYCGAHSAACRQKHFGAARRPPTEFAVGENFRPFFFAVRPRLFSSTCLISPVDEGILGELILFAVKAQFYFGVFSPPFDSDITIIAEKSEFQVNLQGKFAQKQLLCCLLPLSIANHTQYIHGGTE